MPLLLSLIFFFLTLSFLVFFVFRFCSLSLSVFYFSPLFIVHINGRLYYLPWQDLPFLPLNYFWLVVGVFPGLPTGLLTAQPPPLHCVSHVMPHSRQKWFCFVFYFAWHSHPNKGLGFSLTNLYSMHLVISAHICLFWVRCHPSRFKRAWARTPPPPDHTFSYLWPVAHLPCIGWVQVSGAWALCVCSTSIWVLCFFGIHAFAIAYRFVWLYCTLWCLFNSCGVDEFIGLYSLHLISSLGWALLGCGLSLL